MASKNKKLSTPPLWLSLIPVIVTGISLGLSVLVIDAEPHFSLFLGAANGYFHYSFLCWIAMFIAIFFGYANIKMPKHEDLQEEPDDQQ